MNFSRTSLALLAITIGSVLISGSHLSSNDSKSDRAKRVSQLVAELSEKGYNPYSRDVVDLKELGSYGFDALIEVSNELKRIDKKKLTSGSRTYFLEGFSFAMKQIIGESNEVLELQYRSDSEARRYVAVRTACLYKEPSWDIVKKAQFDDSQLIRELAVDLLRRGNIDH